MEENGYGQWKGWGPESFGNLSLPMRRYFDAELTRAGIDRSAPLRALEIGFGGGSFLAYARRNGWAVTGIEADDALLRLGRENGYDVAPPRQLRSLPADSFDLVAAFDVLEHLSHGEIDDLLTQIMRILKTRGVFLARFPNGDSPFGLPNQNNDVTHVTVIGIGKAGYFAARAGAHVAYVGGEAQPLNSGEALRSLHRMLARPIKTTIDRLVNLLFFPNQKICFTSQNLTLILAKMPASDADQAAGPSETHAVAQSIQPGFVE